MNRHLVLVSAIVALQSAVPTALEAQRHTAAGLVNSVDRDSIEKAIESVVGQAHFDPVSFDGRMAVFRREENSFGPGLNTTQLTREMTVTFAPTGEATRIEFRDSVVAYTTHQAKMDFPKLDEPPIPRTGSLTDDQAMNGPRLQYWAPNPFWKWSRSNDPRPRLPRFLMKVQSAFPAPVSNADPTNSTPGQ